VSDQQTKVTAGQEGAEEAQETAASEAVMETNEMSNGWSVRWDPTALGELQARGRSRSRRDEDELGAKGSR
jgi:hypothetical protein